MSTRFANILLPTDFSEMSSPSLTYARDLAEVFDAQLHCLHVVDDAYQYWSAIGPESLPIGPPPEELLQIGRMRMEKYCAAHLAGMKKPAISYVAYGRPFVEIIAYARDHAVDLIVMATHGRGAITHVLLGSTTEKVVRKSPCPVLTVRTSDQPLDNP